MLWRWASSAPGFAPYKNDVLAAYQKALTSACKMPRTDQLLFLQQLTQENGALAADAVNVTSKETSFGIGQWNIKPVSSASWKSRHPEQFTLDWQVAEMARTSCEKYAKYKGNVRRAIVHHNCPQCAIHDAVPSPCGGVDSYRDVDPSPSRRRMSCYFNDEVNGTAARSRFE